MGVRIKAAVVPRSRPLRPLRSHTIATLDSRIGWQVGLWPRRPGAVRTRARAAHRQLGGALEPRLAKWLMHDFGAGLGAIFRRYWHASSQASTFALGTAWLSIGACAIFRCWCHVLFSV